MSGLALTQAPAANLPLRFLASAPCWGVFAGVWLAVHAADALVSRWAPSTVVLVHVMALGVLGNAMLGALAQFLPVAALSPMAGRRVLPVLHVAFNLGLALFVAGLSWMSSGALHAAAVLLVGSLLSFACFAGHALLRGRGPRWLRGGIGLALIALSATALLGALGVLALAGDVTVALDRVIDVHAAFGLIGWVLLLIAVVGAVTLPMLQGTRPVPPRWLYAWMGLTVSGLVAGAVVRMRGDASWLAATAMVASWSLAAASLYLQLRSPHRRNPVLRTSWMLGVAAIAGATAVMRVDADGPGHAVWVGVLALGIGLPLMVTGMMLEIVSFLAWIHLRRVVPRGRQIPGVGRLIPESDKRLVLAMHLSASGGLIAALAMQRAQAFAGVLVALAYLGTLLALLRCGRRVLAFGRDEVSPRAVVSDLTHVNGDGAGRP